MVYINIIDDAIIQITPLQAKEMEKLYYRSREKAFGGWEGVIKSAPLCNVIGVVPKLFLQFDLTYANAEKTKLLRMLGWGHPELFSFMKESGRHVFVDCTYRVVPKGFYQMMVIMVYSMRHESYVPVFYILLQDKCALTYQYAFEQVRDALGSKFDIASFTCDYELPLINAAKKILCHQNTEFILCWFHWKQALRRKLVALKLPNDVIDALVGSEQKREGDVVVEATRGLLNLLTVLPPDEIESIGIPYIRHRMKDIEKGHEVALNSFWAYFIRTWMTTYQVSYWNVFRFIVDDDDEGLPPTFIINRTNNPLERYNRRLNDLFRNPHPRIAQFVDVLRTEADHQLKKLERIIRGEKQPRKHKPVIFTSVPTMYKTFKELHRLPSMEKEILMEGFSDTIGEMIEPNSPQMRVITSRKVTQKHKSQKHKDNVPYKAHSVSKCQKVKIVTPSPPQHKTVKATKPTSPPMKAHKGAPTKATRNETKSTKTYTVVCYPLPGSTMTRTTNVPESVSYTAVGNDKQLTRSQTVPQRTKRKINPTQRFAFQ